MFGQQTTLSGKGIEGGQSGRDFAVVVFDARGWNAIAKGLVGRGANIPRRRTRRAHSGIEMKSNRPTFL